MSTTSQQTQETPHQREALREDSLLVSEWLSTNAWFYDPHQDACYQVTDVGPRQETFTLTKATLVTNQADSQDITQSKEPETTHWISNVCQLTGALEAGDIIGIPEDTTPQYTNTNTDDSVTFTNTGEYLLVTSDTVQDYGNIAISSTGISPRYSDLSPQSVTTQPRYNHDQTDSDIIGVWTVTGTIDIARTFLTTQVRNKGVSSAHESTKPQELVADGADTIDCVAGESSVQTVGYYPGEDPTVISRYVPTSEHPSDTFSEPNLRNFVLTYMQGRVLNACAGPTKLDCYDDGEIIRNDLNPDVDADLHVDVAELAKHFKPNSFSTIIFDPPWSTYQSNMRYDGYMVHKKLGDDAPLRNISFDVRELPFTVPGEKAGVNNEDASEQLTLSDVGSSIGNVEENDEYAYGDPTEHKSQLGHARLAKLGFDYLLKPGGRVIQLAYTGTTLPASLDYSQLVRVAFNPIGEAKTLIGSVDEKQ